VNRLLFSILIFSLILFALIYSFYFSKTHNSKEIVSIQTLKKYVDNSATKLNKPEYNPAAPTLEQIFSNNHNWTSTLSAQKTITLVATGDVIPARSVNYQTINNQDFTWSWKKVVHLLKGDLLFINLESPLLKNCPVTNEGMIFCGDSRHIEGLKFANVSVANFANNHLGNYGIEGIIETKNLLNHNHIAVTGSENTATTTVKDRKIAFLGFNEIGHKEEGISWIDEKLIKNEIQKAKKDADLIVVAYHWGAEYTSQPSSQTIDLAHKTINWGADLIIGNHPHWTQPVEIYKGKIITYAHGNFLFDQEWSQETKEGVVGKYTFYDDKIIDVQFLPIIIENYGQTRSASQQESERILNKMKQESLKL
jgi:poly-gamma-glutamate capsule biosynthesis protein CapA/YwtB (metallophosphatase superfamily)